MKKDLFKKLLIVLFAVASLYMISCKKDEGIQFGASTSPVEALTALSIYTIPGFSSNNNWTSGLIFKSSVNGRITHLGGKLAKGTYTVALWDSSAQTVIKFVVITVTDSTQMSYVDIDDVSITANKAYVISINNTPIGLPYRNYWVYIIYLSTDYLPQVVGNITFEGYLQRNTANPLSIFPADFSNQYFIGVASFKFEPQL
jgi:hypothetical protein